MNHTKTNNIATEVSKMRHTPQKPKRYLRGIIGTGPAEVELASGSFSFSPL